MRAQERVGQREAYKYQTAPSTKLAKKSATRALAVSDADDRWRAPTRDRMEVGRSERTRRLRSPRSVPIKSAEPVRAVNGCRRKKLLVAAGAKGRAEADFPARNTAAAAGTANARHLRARTRIT